MKIYKIHESRNHYEGGKLFEGGTEIALDPGRAHGIRTFLVCDKEGNPKIFGDAKSVDRPGEDKMHRRGRGSSRTK